MTKSHLSPCPSCSRHVRVSETSCPHCGVATSDEFRAIPGPRSAGLRLNRAALFAAGVGAITLAAACSSSGDDAGNYNMGTDYGGPPYDRVDAHEDQNLDASDGSRATDDAAEDAGTDVVVTDAADGASPPDSSM